MSRKSGFIAENENHPDCQKDDCWLPAGNCFLCQRSRIEELEKENERYRKKCSCLWSTDLTRVITPCLAHAVALRDPLTKKVSELEEELAQANSHLTEIDKILRGPFYSEDDKVDFSHMPLRVQFQKRMAEASSNRVTELEGLLREVKEAWLYVPNGPDRAYCAYCCEEKRRGHRPDCIITKAKEVLGGG